MENDKKPKDIVKKLISKYIKAKPTSIRLKLNYRAGNSLISIKSKDLNENVEYQSTIDFTSFANEFLKLTKILMVS